MAVKESKSSNFYFEQSKGCNCPIHSDQPNGRDPTTAPLGKRFADDVEVKTIPRSTAAEIYNAHHRYRKEIPSTNVAHHGTFYQNALMGALTYRFGLGGKRKLRWDEDGSLLARQHTESDFEKLPPDLRQRAKELIPTVTDDQIETERVVSGEKFLEVARICLGVRMPNLASASLARSQDKIIADYCQKNGVEYLMTFVRADYPASMVRALRDRGWQCTGWASPSTAGNRDHDKIRDEYKWRFIAPVSLLREQSELDDWV